MGTEGGEEKVSEGKGRSRGRGKECEGAVLLERLVGCRELTKDKCGLFGAVRYRE